MQFDVILVERQKPIFQYIYLNTATTVILKLFIFFISLAL